MSSPSSKRGGIGGAANEEDNNFFKVMLGDFRDRMTIPDKFVQQFRSQITRTVKLESRNGDTFDVHVTQDLHKLVLQSRWEVFVNAHGITMGDFLSCLSMKSAPREGQEWGEKLTGTLGMRHDLSMRSPQSCVSSSEDELQAHPVRRLILVRGTCATGSQKKEMKVKIRDIYSEIPILGCTIRKSSIHGKPYMLEICREYAEVYLPFEDETIALRRHGKIWKVRCCIRQYGSKRLLKGWSQFVRGNNLRLGDICLFKLQKNKKYTMDVYIVRKE
ncbi:hypothetical protein D1007_44341 [Hordeum vulgare]|nr:hypothetical protein D1007_44341 [Hordeum vulgare]